jgi:hypothetical protein
METSKYLNQSLLILVVSVCVIILLIIYSYKNKFTDSAIEGFETDTTTTTTNSLLKPIAQREIDELDTLHNQLSNINIMKSQIYNNYSVDDVKQYEDVLKLNPEVFKFDTKNYATNFYQSLQDQEIEDLQSKYKDLSSQLESIPTTPQNNINKIKHISSGTVFNINGNPLLGGFNFNIVLDSDKSMCLEFKSLNADYIKSQPITKEVNNINKVACDYGNIQGSKYIQETLKKQKFKAVKITNNTEYNDNLHSIYGIYQISEPESYGTTDYANSLNNYPYYLIKPAFSSDENMCLTLTNGMLSVEPCDGSDKQKFELLSLDY